jgi:hypothetical protein
MKPGKTDVLPETRLPEPERRVNGAQNGDIWDMQSLTIKAVRA